MMKAVRQLASRALGEKPVLTLDDSADGGERRFRAEPCAHQVAANPRESAVASLDDLSKARREQLGSSILHAGCFRRQAWICSRPEPFCLGESAWRERNKCHLWGRSLSLRKAWRTEFCSRRRMVQGLYATSFHNANTRLGFCLLGNGSAAYAGNDYDFTADTIYKIGPNGASNFITSHDIGLEAGPAPGGSLRLLREGVNAAFEFPTAPASGPGIGGIFGECRARLASYAQVALVVLRKIPQAIGAGIFPHLLR